MGHIYGTYLWDVFMGRVHSDFKKLNPEYFCEMDTVLSAQAAIDEIKSTRHHDFLRVFRICLTVRSSEFGNLYNRKPISMEPGAHP